jgi:PAS domain S-box-containing protein
VATDADLNVVAWNAAATHLFGRSPEQMLGKPLASIAGAKGQAVLERVLRRTLDDGQSRDFEVSRPDPEGKPRDLLAIISRVPGSNGSIEGLAAWVQDITQRKQLTDRLAKSEKMASLGTLAGGVAHHFNNIIGGVATYVDFALTSKDPAAARRALQMTAEASARVAKITQSLLSFAEQDSRRIDLADLTEVVFTFVNLVERPLAEQGITVHVHRNDIPIVPVESNGMHQVLGNLLTNAEEAMPEGGELRLTLDGDEKWVWLDFADTGCGLEMAHLPMVFEPFFTTKGLLAGGDAGNPGLGLSVAHGIITEMGGDIAAINSDGGACFRIRFPSPKPVVES